MKKFKLTMIITLVGLLVTSCGSDSGGGNSGNWYVPNGSNNQYTSQTEYNLYSQLTGAFRCQNGRRSNDVVGNIQTAYSQTTIGGNLQMGALSGSTGTQYVGVTIENDFMIVTEVVSGNNVVGYNIRLSLCNRYLQPNQYGTSFPLISDARGISAVAAQNGIVLDKDTNCSAGFVDSAQNLMVLIDPYNYNSNYGTGTLQQTTYSFYFYPPGC